MGTTTRIGRFFSGSDQPVITGNKVIKIIRRVPSIRFLIPGYRSYRFGRAIRKVSMDPSCLIRESNLVDDLIKGWRNKAWSASDEYLSVCVKYASMSDGPILECGSGLSTLVTGLIAQKTGNTVWSLEHVPEWGQRVEQYLDKYHIESVNVSVNPLKDYGEFSWYNPPLNLMPEKFSLVLCDGPPGTIPGGRYGLMPLMEKRLAPGCVILLDDAEREQEQKIVSDWERDFNISYTSSGIRKPFFIIKLSDVLTGIYS